MKIGIVGSGNMGRTLGLLWQEKGYDVFFGARSQTHLDYIQSLSPAVIKSGTLQEAVAYGDVLFYSLRDVVPSTICDKEAFTNKVIIDPNNGEIPENFHYPPRIISYAELYQNDVPHALVVKAFNTMAQEIYYVPTDDLKAYNLMCPFCTDQEEAKQAVSELIDSVGLIPLDCGTLKQGAALLESFADLARLLIINKQMGANLGFSYSILPEAERKAYGTRQATNYK